MGIWNELRRGFSVLAPMEDVTDTVFRRIVQAAGAPDLLVTEFTSTDGLCTPGRPRVIGRLRYTFGEKPLIAQVWGTNRRTTAAWPRRSGRWDSTAWTSTWAVPCARSFPADLRRPDREPASCGGADHRCPRGAGGMPVSVKTRIGVTRPTPGSGWVSSSPRDSRAHRPRPHRRPAVGGGRGLGAVALAVRLRDEAGLQRVSSETETCAPWRLSARDWRKQGRTG